MIAFRHQHGAVVTGKYQGVDWLACFVQRRILISIDALKGVALRLVDLVEIDLFEICLDKLSDALPLLN